MSASEARGSPLRSRRRARPIEIQTNQEYWGVDFAVVDSNFKFADYVDETLRDFRGLQSEMAA
jgi:hypothetical protein